MISVQIILTYMYLCSNPSLTFKDFFGENSDIIKFMKMFINRLAILILSHALSFLITHHFLFLFFNEVNTYCCETEVSRFKRSQALGLGNETEVARSCC